MRIMNKGIFPFLVVVVAELLKFKDNLRREGKEKKKKKNLQPLLQ